jgi:hypothetical protein
MRKNATHQMRTTLITADAEPLASEILDRLMGRSGACADRPEQWRLNIRAKKTDVRSTCYVIDQAFGQRDDDVHFFGLEFLDHCSSSFGY